MLRHEDDVSDEHEEEKEEIDDDFDESSLPQVTYMNKGRTAVSAEAFGEWNRKEEFTPPVHPKTCEQKESLVTMLSDSFLFNTLDRKDLLVIIDAIEQVVVPAGVRVINQGDIGDFLFVIESGTLNCLKLIPGETSEQVVKICGPGDVFGELSLLYNSPRAASVETSSDSILWKLDRSTFTHVVRDSASRKRERYEAFLQSVPLLRTVGVYELSQIADALKPKKFNPGEIIVSEGEPGDTFYMIEEGTADAYKSGYHVLHYSTPGEYFGELALIHNEPRAASVKAGENGCEVLMLNRRSFTRLLGNLNELIKKEYTS
jgi:cAMP-dependent protein kinase regulator